MSPQPVILFDIDGTVLTYAGPAPSPGRRALDQAARDLHDVDGASDGLRFAGATDRSLVRAILVRAGLDAAEEAIDRILAVYARHLEAFVLPGAYRALGDVASAVQTLQRDGATVGLATGNIRKGARLKLASAGLLSSFDLDRGGFGCDAEARADIVRVAADRCRHGGGPPTTVIVVGDTRHDVAAARAVGARVVGIASRPETRAELEEAGADAIVEACGEELVSALRAL